MIDSSLNGISCLLCNLEADGLLRLVLHHQGAGDGMATMRHVADLQSDKVTASELAVDGEVEHCQLADAMFKVEPNPEGPDFLQLERRLGVNKLALVPGFPWRLPGLVGNE
jgi:hypothetical protein